MNYTTKVITLISILFIIGTTYVSSIEARGLGVGPNIIVIDDALRGASYQQSIWIYNEDEYDKNVILNLTGDIKDFITFYDFKNASVPINSVIVKNMSSKPILLDIAISENISNKYYNGSIMVTAKPIESDPIDGNYSSVNLNLPIVMSIKVVGDQILNVSILRLDIENTEITYNSRLRVQFENTGNVVASPKIDVTMTKDGMYIDKISSVTSPIRPHEIHTETMYWDTTGKVSGNYQAHFNITLAGKKIKEEIVTFELYPPGTLTRSARLKEITYEGALEKGKVLKIVALFQNTGEIYTKAKFIGEVFRNGKLIETLESQEILVQKYEEKEISSYLQIEEDGQYTVKGHALYDGRTTNTVELKFNVGDVFIFELFYIPIIVIFILLSLVIINHYKRKEKRVINGKSYIILTSFFTKNKNSNKKRKKLITNLKSENVTKTNTIKNSNDQKIKNKKELVERKKSFFRKTSKPKKHLHKNKTTLDFKSKNKKLKQRKHIIPRIHIKRRKKSISKEAERKSKIKTKKQSELKQNYKPSKIKSVNLQKTESIENKSKPIEIRQKPFYASEKEIREIEKFVDDLPDFEKETSVKKQTKQKEIKDNLNKTQSVSLKRNINPKKRFRKNKTKKTTRLSLKNM